MKNPILVARLVLDASIQPLSLSRVPPNFLVGEGAVDFAETHGVNILPKDFLVSNGAKHRWQNWRKDLVKAEAEEQKKKDDEVCNQKPYHSAPATPAVLSTSLSPPITPRSASKLVVQPQNVSKHAAADGPPLRFSKELNAYFEDDELGTDDNLATMAQTRKRQRTDGSSFDHNDDNDTYLDPNSVTSTYQRVYRSPSDDHPQKPYRPPSEDQDHITDTVGAIAIDCFGRIAAGSSSGGIGMKHKGRCGPAALVGISTAVIPADPDDPDEQCVATVTSGTGEHMATTAAAQTAADRILSCTMKVHGQLQPCTEDEALFSMIKNDFMKHPGVQNSPCQGALGVLCVKKTKQGIYFYFGHNTDSFALASMHSDERKPVCVMSRSRESGLIAQGARKCRPRRA